MTVADHTSHAPLTLQPFLSFLHTLILSLRRFAALAFTMSATSPAPPCTSSSATTDKGYIGVGMNGFMARWYDKNRGFSVDQQLLAAHVRALLPHGGRILEIAPGPGHLSIDLARNAAYTVTAIDISPTCVAIARQHADEAKVTVDFQHGNAASLPFSDDSFDLILCSAAFKNFTQPASALHHIHRTLRTVPAGRAIIVDLRRDATMAEVDEMLQRDEPRLGWLSRRLTKLIFRWMLLKRAYTAEEMERMVRAAGFSQCDCVQDGIGFRCTMTK